MADSLDTPPEAPCDHCAQTRPLFLYRPKHDMHLGGYGLTCRWCDRVTQPLLCAPCWGTERGLEENDPGLNREADILEDICATNARVDALRAADRDTCEGIAHATAQTEGGAH